MMQSCMPLATSCGCLWMFLLLTARENAAAVNTCTRAMPLRSVRLLLAVARYQTGPVLKFVTF
jgi:hypothetical protein